MSTCDRACLVAVSNQGGEAGYRQIAEDLAPAFAEATENELKPLLVIWADNDSTGRKTFIEGLSKECYKHGIVSVALDPLMLWFNMPDGGDVKDWIEHCRQEGICDRETIRRLEFAINEAINLHEIEIRWRSQRQAWNAPVSHNGEIGRWEEDKQGNKYWQPLCNFDFQVVCELEDSLGGGLVLEVKRSFEQQQHRVILNSVDYTTVDKFEDALKAELHTGIVCNLSKPQLKALVHTRLHEYRTNRQGKRYKRIDRYGQQNDGVWVLGDRQYTPDGKPTSENETKWVFYPNLGKEDFIPCPELAPEDPDALKRLVNASRQFFGQQNIYSLLLTMGWVIAGLHFQVIYGQEKCFPLFNSHGEPGSLKTLAAETALSLVGKNWSNVAMLSRVSLSALYEHGSRTGSLPFFWDDPERKPEFEEVAKSWFNCKPRKVRNNEQTPHSPMGITSNHIFGGDQSAALTRFIRVPFKRHGCGDKEAFQQLRQAQEIASGAFGLLIQLGYPREEIATLERKLLSYLPLAHARIAQSLAIVTYYAQKIVDLTGGSENILKWVILNLCQDENDAENSGDSLQDFIAKILSLETRDLVGDWNKLSVTTQEGRSWVAIYAEDIWGLVDRHYQPSTYNKKSLKSLVLAAGGKVDSVQRFALSRNEVMTYNAAKINPRLDRDGNEISPNPPRTVTRKAWLLPIELFADIKTFLNSSSDRSPDLSISENTLCLPQDAVVTNTVTTVTELLPLLVTTQNLDAERTLANSEDDVTSVTKKINEIETKHNPATAQTAEIPSVNLAIDSRNSGNEVTPIDETQLQHELPLVTSSVTQGKNKAVTEENTVLEAIASQEVPSTDTATPDRKA